MGDVRHTGRRRSLGMLIVGALLGAASSCARERPPAMAGWRAEAPLADGRGGSVQRGFATYYAQRFSGRRTANGERYDPREMTAAHRSLPFGTVVEVRRATGARPRAVVVRINDRGPYGANRIIDLSFRAAQELGIVVEGKVEVELRVVSSPTASSAAHR